MVRRGRAGSVRKIIRQYVASILLLSGCAPGQKIYGVLAYPWNGHQILAETDKHSLHLYDLDAEKDVWRVEVQRPAGWYAAVAVFSANDSYFVLAEQQYPASTVGRYSIWERATGRRVSPVYEISGSWVSKVAGLHVSGDGRWFACTHDGKHLRVYEAATQRVALEVPGGVLEHTPLDFSPDSRWLIKNHTVYRLEGDAWVQAADFPDARGHAWLGDRLAVARNDGFDIWQGTVTQHVPFAAGTRGNVLRASPDGHLLAVVEAEGDDPTLMVYDLDRSAVRFTRRGLGSNLSVYFRGEVPVLLAFRNVYDTFVVELDPRTGATAHEASFGAWGRGSQPASPDYTAFTPNLLPTGRYIALFEPLGGTYAKVRRVEY